MKTHCLNHKAVFVFCLALSVGGGSGVHPFYAQSSSTGSSSRNPATNDSSSFVHSVTVRPSSLRDSLLLDEDTDGDKRITINDRHILGTDRGDKRFWFSPMNDPAQRFEISGTYYLSNLLQDLSLAIEEHRDTAVLSPGHIFEPPADHISRSIRELFWDGLTRRVDETGLQNILHDEKITSVDGFRYVYVPHDDMLAANYFADVARRHPDWKMKVVQLPPRITPDYVHSLDGRPGILSLALEKDSAGMHGKPFVVPGGRFNEMYGWDSYFITLGLLQDGRIDLAKSMVDNFTYEITHYGAILNANRTYYLTRSQPPFFTSMVRAVYERLPKNAESKSWLRSAMEAGIAEYTDVWMNADRLTATGLSRYYDIGRGISPEVEPGHFDPVFAEFAKKHRMDPKTFEKEYRAGKIHDAELDSLFVHDRSMRESGHDTSYRLIGRAADLTTVDLNSLLYKIELDIADMIETAFGGTLQTAGGREEKASDWRQRAERRKGLIDRYLWDAGKGMFFDYDIARKELTGYVSATTFYPMWANLATKEQAASLVKNALPLLLMPGGIAASSEQSRGTISPNRPQRQWDFPFGWAPHQMILWRALMNYGYDSLAQDVIYRWLFTITSNAADYNGTVPEKFDVAHRTHDVFAEYGNVGTKFSYITREGFGWTNASFEIGFSMLSQRNRDGLNRLIPPEWK